MNPPEDIQNLCRLCGSKTKPQGRVDIFNNGGLELDINTKISNCLGLDVSENDYLPKVVCTECVDNLENFNQFKIRSHKTSYMLNDLVNEQMILAIDDEPSQHSDNNETDFEPNIFEPELNIKTDTNSSVLTATARKKRKKNVVKAVHKKTKVKNKTTASVKRKSKNSIRKNSTEITGPLVCDFCTKVYDKKRILTRHIINTHLAERRIGCSYCIKKFKTNSALKAHLKRHEKRYDYICNFCGKGSIGRQQFEYHIRSKHTKEFPFECDKCSKKFVSSSLLKTHEMTAHNDNRFDFVCDVCNKAFKCKYYLNSHKKSHELPIEERRKFQCNVCSASFTTRRTLKRHMTIHTGETPFECQICKNSYKDKKGLEVHMLIHSGVKEFVCDFCGKAFALKNNLDIHRLIHLGIRKFKCQDCGKTFTQNSSLNLHRKKSCPGRKMVNNVLQML